MSHITLEFSSLESLSKVQIEAVAEFILAFPVSEVEVSAKQLLATITPEQAFARLAVEDDAPDFMTLLIYAGTQVQNKKLSIEEVNTIIQNAGVPSLPWLQNRPDLVPQIHASLQELIANRDPRGDRALSDSPDDYISIPAFTFPDEDTPTATQ
jgi:hypothetical protein